GGGGEGDGAALGGSSLYVLAGGRRAGDGAALGGSSLYVLAVSVAPGTVSAARTALASQRWADALATGLGEKLGVSIFAFPAEIPAPPKEEGLDALVGALVVGGVTFALVFCLAGVWKLSKP
ncbi:hypothetical protein T484DRAFT_1875421, partial [Baffinella frigidus]